MAAPFHLKTGLLIGLLHITLHALAQHATEQVQAPVTIDSFIQYLRKDVALEARLKSQLADSLFQVCGRMNLTCQQMECRILQSYSLDEMGLVDSALIQLLWVNTMLRPDCGPHLRWWLYTGLTSVYLTLGEYRKVDSLVTITKKEWYNSHSDHAIYFSILTNGAIALAQEGDTDSAVRLLAHVLSEARRVGENKFVQKSLINLATIKGMLQDLDSAYYFLGLAAANMQATDDVDSYMTLQINMAIMDQQEGRYLRAHSRLDTAEQLAIRFNNLPLRASILDNRAYVAEEQSQFSKAYGYLRQYVTLHDSILDLDRIKVVTEMQEKYESEKKARQIQELKIANLDATINTERIRNTRNRYLFLGAGTLLFAIGLYARLRYVRKTKSIIQKEKEISEGLLLNILPASVAEELKSKGYTDAQHFEQATILFSDFKGFTTLSEQLSPTELVNELNACFKAFDEIITRHGIEKIKTIGDSYMAVGSIPAQNMAKAPDVVTAGIEMQEFVIARKAERETQGLPGFEMRVGIHSGPVVAGVVGVKKFQYDIWGDTVNIASRMESAGETGKVNISATTYQLVNTEPAFVFTPRGLVSAKGKGEMEMYFVENREK